MIYANWDTRMSVDKKALDYLIRSQVGVRAIARELHITVSEVHHLAKCASGGDCKGPGCRIR